MLPPPPPFHILASLLTLRMQLTDLKKPPVDLSAALGGSSVDPISGILGAELGESSSQTAARIEEAKKSANNISGLVRKKAKEEANGRDANGVAGGKRKADEGAMEGVEKGNGEGSKKARVEDAMES